jgi:hypothetical protein
MTWKPRRPKHPWRKFLTPDEKDLLDKVEAAKAAWRALNESRRGIINRAGRRARYHAQQNNLDQTPDWREFLAHGEQQILARGERAKLVWRKLNKERRSIYNRANTRAAYYVASGNTKRTR